MANRGPGRQQQPVAQLDEAVGFALPTQCTVSPRSRGSPPRLFFSFRETDREKDRIASWPANEATTNHRAKGDLPCDALIVFLDRWWNRKSRGPGLPPTLSAPLPSSHESRM